jgi:chromosome segregation ATPase
MLTEFLTIGGTAIVSGLFGFGIYRIKHRKDWLVMGQVFKDYNERVSRERVEHLTKENDLAKREQSIESKESQLASWQHEMYKNQGTKNQAGYRQAMRDFKERWGSMEGLQKKIDNLNIKIAEDTLKIERLNEILVKMQETRHTLAAQIVTYKQAVESLAAEVEEKANEQICTNGTEGA